MFYHFSNVVCGVLVCPHVTVILVIISSSLRKFFLGQEKNPLCYRTGVGVVVSVAMMVMTRRGWMWVVTGGSGEESRCGCGRGYLHGGGVAGGGRSVEHRDWGGGQRRRDD